MNINDRESRLKKLREAKNKLKKVENYPTFINENKQIENELSILNKKVSLKTKIDNLTYQSLKDASIILKEKGDDLLEVVFIFDKSGSCYGTERQTISGFNEVISREKNNNRNDIISTILFDNKTKIIHNRLPIECVSNFVYEASGNTALYDTLVEQINRIKHQQEIDVSKPKKTLVVIMTDGEDICSRKYSANDVKDVIKERVDAGWQFIYLGVNVDVKDEASLIGIEEKNAVLYNQDRLHDSFEAIYKALGDVHNNGDITNNWSSPITDNYNLEEKVYTKKLLGDNNEK